MKTESESSKLWDMLGVYEMILHPDIFGKLKKQLQAAYDENRKDAFASAGISEEAKEVDRLILTCRERIERDKFPRSLCLKVLYKDLISLYKIG